MEPHGDPEARIRDLERPLAERAQANELGTTPHDIPPPPTVPVPLPVPPDQDGLPPHPDPYYAQPHSQYGTAQYSSPYYSPPQRVVRKRSQTAALWAIPLAVVGVLVAVIAGIVMYVNLGSPDSYTHNPSPPVSGGGGALDTPPTPQVETRIDSSEQVVTVDSGGFVSVAGVGTQQTVVCNDGTVNISGVNNTIEVQGSCTSVIVSGVENTVSVETAGSISASGFDNRVTFRTGAPEISKSGTGNVVEQG